jgi:DNA-binding NarL/FixJ family response regulator
LNESQQIRSAGSRRAHVDAEPTGAAEDVVRVLVAHRHRLVAEALDGLLADRGIAVVGISCDRDGLLTALPDVVVETLVLDPGLDPAGGVVALLEDVHAASPATSIVVLAEALDDELALAAEDGTLDGLVLVSDDGSGLAAAVKQVAAKHVVFPAGWLSRAHRAAEANPLSDLTPRQREVLHLVAEGMDNEEIARRLFISRNTVKAHVRTIYQALGVHNRVEAARELAGARAFGMGVA